jgi:hypothetical protein
MPNPLDVACPACFSKPGERCTQPDDHGRHEVSRIHYVRDYLAESTEWCDAILDALYNGEPERVRCYKRGSHAEHSGFVYAAGEYPLATVTWPDGISANREQRRHP